MVYGVPAAQHRQEGERERERAFLHHHAKKPDRTSMVSSAWLVPFVMGFAPVQLPMTRSPRMAVLPSPRAAPSLVWKFDDDDGLDAEVKAAVHAKSKEVATLRQSLRSAEAWADVLQGTVKALSETVEAAECRAVEAEAHVAKMSTEIENLHAEVERHQHHAAVTEARLREFTGKAPLALAYHGVALHVQLVWEGCVLPAARWCAQLPQAILHSLAETSQLLGAWWVRTSATGLPWRRREPLEPQSASLNVRRGATMLYYRLQGYNAASHGAPDSSWQRVSTGVSASGIRGLQGGQPPKADKPAPALGDDEK